MTDKIEYTSGDPSLGAPISSSWTSSTGVLIVITSYPKAGESGSDWRIRHNDHFAAMWTVFPPAG